LLVCPLVGRWWEPSAEREREGAVVGHPTAVLPTGISHDLRSVASIRHGRGWRTPTASPIADVLDSYLRGEVGVRLCSRSCCLALHRVAAQGVPINLGLIQSEGWRPGCGILSQEMGETMFCDPAKQSKVCRKDCTDPG
jgi:hypothetical protein